MKTTIYLVRHAEAQGNVDRTFQGHSDCPVTERGHKQLDCLAERFRTVEFDAIYASPLLRTRQTAQAINRFHGLEIQIEPGLIEINGGGFEGLHWDELESRYPEEHRLWETDPAHFKAPEGGDSMADVRARMTGAMDRIARANAGGTVVVASHGCAIRNYLCAAKGWGLERLREIPWEENTAVCQFEYDSGFLPTIICQNDASHLPAELCTMRGQGWWKTSVTEEKA